MVNPNKFYTYAYLREDRTPYYIGKGKDDRAYNKNRKNIKPPKDKSKILILKNNLTEEEAFNHEIYMISVFGRKDLRTGILHNKTNGGDGASGAIRSKETKNKLSKALSGKNNPFYGKTLSQETKDKISKALSGENHPFYGKTLPQETKNKLSKVLSGENNPFYGKTGENHPSSKYWKITFADGRMIIQCGISNWATENGYNKGHISNVYMGRHKRHKDIVAVEKLAHTPLYEVGDVV